MSNLEQELADLDQQIASLEQRRVLISNQISDERHLHEQPVGLVVVPAVSEKVVLFPLISREYFMQMDGTSPW